LGGCHYLWVVIVVCHGLLFMGGGCLCGQSLSVGGCHHHGGFLSSMGSCHLWAVVIRGQLLFVGGGWSLSVVDGGGAVVGSCSHGHLLSGQVWWSCHLLGAIAIAISIVGICHGCHCFWHCHCCQGVCELVCGGGGGDG